MTTLTISRYAIQRELRRGDRIIEIDGRPVFYTVAAKADGNRVKLVNETGSEVEWFLYIDSHVQANITYRREVKSQRRTRHGLTLVTRDGGWETEDGLYRIQEEQATTFCDAPHPVRTGRNEGWYCDGGGEHAYRVWTVFEVAGTDVLDGGIANTFDDAWSTLADHLAK